MTKKKLLQIVKEEARKLVSERVVPGQPYSPPQDPRLKYSYPPMGRLKAALDELLGEPIIRYKVKHVDEDGSVNSPAGAGLKYNVDITVLDEGKPNLDENRKGDKIVTKRQLLKIIKEEVSKLLKEQERFAPNPSGFRSGERNADAINRFRSKGAKRRRAMRSLKPGTGDEFNPKPGSVQYAKTDRELDTMTDDMQSLSVGSMYNDASIAQADREAAAQYFDADQKRHHMADRFKNQGQGPTKASARKQAALEKVKQKYARKIALVQKELQRAQDANASEDEIDNLEMAIDKLKYSMDAELQGAREQSF